MLSVFEYTKGRAWEAGRGVPVALSPQPKKLRHWFWDSLCPPSRDPHKVPKDGIKFIFNHCHLSLSLGPPNGYPEVNLLLFLFPHPIRAGMADAHRAETQH